MCKLQNFYQHGVFKAKLKEREREKERDNNETSNHQYRINN